MANVVRAALVQQKWTGDKDSMVKNAVAAVREAAAQGARVTCLQELFYGPYFCQVQEPQWYSWAEAVPDGPTVRLMRDVAREHEMVLIVPVYEAEQEGVLYNTAAVIDADGTFLGKHRKNHIPQVKGFWEKYYFRPGNLGYPVFDTAVGRIGVYICYERHFPEGWRALGLAGAKIVFNPSATSRGLSEYLWRLEQTAPRWPTSTSSAPSTGSGSSRSAPTTSTGSPISPTRAGRSSAGPRPTPPRRSSSATWTWGC